MARDAFGARASLDGAPDIYRLDRLARLGVADVSPLPHTVRILLESLLRTAGGLHVREFDVEALARWPQPAPSASVPFAPARVVLQDFTGVPAVVDLAAMRAAIARAGIDPERVDPLVPCDLVIDHSVQVDAFGSAAAYARNIDREYERNTERYQLLRWAQGAFGTFRVVPPGMGIVHQVNLEHLASVVAVRPDPDGDIAIPDTLVGTDSHTTMINGLGVLGWGVGGIEAEAVMLGEPLVLPAPVVLGVRFAGALRAGVTATDLVLTLTELLRRHGVVGAFVEFCGDGLSALSLADRATLSNMCPEYGATAALFPVDDEALRYLRATGRDEAAALADRVCKEQGLFRRDGDAVPVFSELVELDLGSVEASLAGPRRPQDRVPLAGVRASFADAFGNGSAPVTVEVNGARGDLADGSVVIAAITSCTNTSNPSVMVAAGLLARNAVARGLRSKPWVKTSLAPGSRVVTDYLAAAGLDTPLEALGFHLVGYGCTTCIGNSGPLPDEVAAAVTDGDLKVVAVLSGNRNFEGRIHPQVRASYLASPPLVVAYALAGTTDVDLENEPIGEDASGAAVYLRELWPSAGEVRDTIARTVTPELFEREYGRIWDGDERWRALPAPAGALFTWDAASTYVREPAFFQGMDAEPSDAGDIEGARCLVLVGDSVTTDHISPAGAIPRDMPAGRYLTEHRVQPRDFNSFGSRRGNHEVMVRGTFGNIRLRNALADGGREGGWTTHQPSCEPLSIYDAAERYRTEGVPLIAIAGREYGTGSSRDWAAKGTLLLGIRAVLAQTYERIHRSNLVGMGVVPLQFREGEGAASLGLTGREEFAVHGLAGGVEPGQTAVVEARDGGGALTRFEVIVRVDSPAEVEYLRHGGILPMVLRQMMRG